MSSWLGMVSFIVSMIQLTQQVSVHPLAIYVEFLLWPVFDLEDSYDSRHLLLASPDHPFGRSRVWSTCHSTRANISLIGTPLWLVSVYSDSFGAINKYWPPAMWYVVPPVHHSLTERFLPGLMTMEIVTLGFPIVQMHRHQKASREISGALADFDARRLTKQSHADSSTLESGSFATRSTGSKGKMYSMESLDECLHGCHDGLQVYASCMELNGENIIFLVKVLKFKKLWRRTFSTSNDFLKARATMFRAALSIFISLIHCDTASYPINIESPIYQKLDIIFGQATALMASRRRGSTSSTPVSQVTPWDEPADLEDMPDMAGTTHMERFHMRHLAQQEAQAAASPTRTLSREDKHSSASSTSSQKIDEKGGITVSETTTTTTSELPSDPLAGFHVPVEFDAHAFDAAFKSIKYMVWTETWQRYMTWKRTSGTED